MQEVVFPPSNSEYVPTGQAIHTDAWASEYVPALHGKQVVLSAAPKVVEYDPALQDLHNDLDFKPVDSEYVPAGHKKQELALMDPTLSE
jgi:hypothetical protein